MTQPLANLSPQQIRAVWTVLAAYVEKADETESRGEAPLADIDEAREVFDLLENYIAEGAAEVIMESGFTTFSDVINKGLKRQIAR